MDMRTFWALSPSVSRTYKQCVVMPLEADPSPSTVMYDELFCTKAPPPTALSHASLSRFIKDSVAINQRKSSGRSEWTLRVHASSGALYPIETYIVTRAYDAKASGGGAGVFHYDVMGHNLEQRAELSAADASWLPENAFVVALSTLQVRVCRHVSRHVCMHVWRHVYRPV